MKRFIIAGSLILGIALVYVTGIYTYFIRTDIQEALPIAETRTQPENSTPIAPSVVEPKTLASGSFQPIDVIHKGSGQAKIIEIDGKKILRLENFSVTSGPDLYVYLSTTERPTGDVQSLGEFIDLGRLKGTSGNQTYTLPNNADNHRTAVVWCKRFGVLFTYALMQ